MSRARPLAAPFSVEALEQRCVLSSEFDNLAAALSPLPGHLASVPGGAFKLRFEAQFGFDPEEPDPFFFGPLEWEARLSIDSIWGNEDDVVVGGNARPGEFVALPLRGNRGQTAWWLLAQGTIPSDVPIGEYHVGVMIDSTNLYPETTETDNIAMSLGPIYRVLEAPQVSVTGLESTTPIEAGPTAPSAATGTTFGTVSIMNESAIRRFTIANLAAPGGMPLDVSRVRILGAHAVDFDVVRLRHLQDTGTYRLSIAFDPRSAAGPRTATVAFLTNDPDQPEYRFRIKGTGTYAGLGYTEANAPDIQVAFDDTLIGSGIRRKQTTFAPFLDDPVLVRTFTISNIGGSDLVFAGGVGGLTQQHPTEWGQFTIVSGPTAGQRLAPGASIPLQVQFEHAGTPTPDVFAFLSLACNDPNEFDYTMWLKGRFRTR